MWWIDRSSHPTCQQDKRICDATTPEQLAELFRKQGQHRVTAQKVKRLLGSVPKPYQKPCKSLD